MTILVLFTFFVAAFIINAHTQEAKRYGMYGVNIVSHSNKPINESKKFSNKKAT